jgi:hypothetical protein
MLPVRLIRAGHSGSMVITASSRQIGNSAVRRLRSAIHSFSHRHRWCKFGANGASVFCVSYKDNITALGVAEGGDHFENLTPGWEGATMPRLVCLHRVHEFAFGDRVVSFAGRRVHVSSATATFAGFIGASRTRSSQGFRRVHSLAPNTIAHGASLHWKIPESHHGRSGVQPFVAQLMCLSFDLLATTVPSNIGSIPYKAHERTSTPIAETKVIFARERVDS